MSMLISIVLVVVGLGALQAGIQELGAQNSNLEMALLYLSITVFSFGFVMLTIVRTRRGFAISFLAPNKVLSVIRCAQCSFKQIKNFSLGDYVFKMAGTCTQCGNQTLFINEIYAEDLKKR